MATARKGARNKKVEQAEAKNILEFVKKMDIPTVIEDVNGLQVKLQTTLSELNSTLTSRIEQVKQIDTAIELKEARLKELYQIEDMAITLDEMKAQREEEEKSSELRTKEREAQWAEQEATRSKKWKREEEEAEYNRTQSAKKWKDTFDTEVATAKRVEAARVELVERDLADREAAIKAQENEIVVLRAQVAEFDTKLKAEVDKQTAIVGNSMKRDHKHELDLLKKDTELKEQLAAQKAESLQATIDALRTQVSTLEGQLSQTREDAKEVTTQALQSASGREVVASLQRVVDGKDTGTGTGKGGRGATT